MRFHVQRHVFSSSYPSSPSSTASSSDFIILLTLLDNDQERS